MVGNRNRKAIGETMRASKENAERAMQSLKRITKKHGSSATTTTIFEFIKAAKAKLPSEAAYDADRARKRRKPDTVKA